jgi:hypothetical protein
MLRIASGLWLALALTLPGCVAEDNSPGAEPSSECVLGCEAALAADCDNGPATQAQCEQDCQRLQTGSCSASYLALQSCAEGEPLTCNEMGLPFVTACEAEQNAFVACLTGG